MKPHLAPRTSATKRVSPARAAAHALLRKALSPKRIAPAPAPTQRSPARVPRTGSGKKKAARRSGRRSGSARRAGGCDGDGDDDDDESAITPVGKRRAPRFKLKPNMRLSPDVRDEAMHRFSLTPLHAQIAAAGVLDRDKKPYMFPLADEFLDYVKEVTDDYLNEPNVAAAKEKRTAVRYLAALVARSFGMLGLPLPAASQSVPMHVAKLKELHALNEHLQRGFATQCAL